MTADDDRLREILNDLPDKRLFMPQEVADFFRVSVASVYRWCDIGALTSVKIGGVIRITRASVIEYFLTIK